MPAGDHQYDDQDHDDQHLDLDNDHDDQYHDHAGNDHYQDWQHSISKLWWSDEDEEKRFNFLSTDECLQVSSISRSCEM